ncbi:hemerythrin domain-containing protein [Vulgatibacter sp.]|uniref:hemerythrin domain-containing protein n=1 Tax=Vulgatibacter sp. TaxID=1971226 RepID=UPI00356520D9
MRQSWIAELEENHRDHEAILAGVIASLRAAEPDVRGARSAAARLHTDLHLHVAYAQEVLGPWAERLLADGAVVRARMEQDHDVLQAALTAARYALHLRAIDKALQQFEALADGLRRHTAWEQALSLRLRQARKARTASGS